MIGRWQLWDGVPAAGAVTWRAKGFLRQGFRGFPVGPVSRVYRTLSASGAYKGWSPYYYSDKRLKRLTFSSLAAAPLDGTARPYEVTPTQPYQSRAAVTMAAKLSTWTGADEDACGAEPGGATSYIDGDYLDSLAFTPAAADQAFVNPSFTGGVLLTGGDVNVCLNDLMVQLSDEDLFSDLASRAGAYEFDGSHDRQVALTSAQAAAWDANHPFMLAHYINDDTSRPHVTGPLGGHYAYASDVAVWDGELELEGGGSVRVITMEHAGADFLQRALTPAVGWLYYLWRTSAAAVSSSYPLIPAGTVIDDSTYSLAAWEPLRLPPVTPAVGTVVARWVYRG